MKDRAASDIFITNLEVTVFKNLNKRLFCHLSFLESSRQKKKERKRYWVTGYL